MLPPVEPATACVFTPADDARERDRFIVEDARHVAADERHHGDEHGAEERDLKPALQHQTRSSNVMATSSAANDSSAMATATMSMVVTLGPGSSRPREDSAAAHQDFVKAGTARL
jgi:hypothetical protein